MTIKVLLKYFADGGAKQARTNKSQRLRLCILSEMILFVEFLKALKAPEANLEATAAFVELCGSQRKLKDLLSQLPVCPDAFKSP